MFVFVHAKQILDRRRLSLHFPNVFSPHLSLSTYSAAMSFRDLCASPMPSGAARPSRPQPMSSTVGASRGTFSQASPPQPQMMPPPHAVHADRPKRPQPMPSAAPGIQPPMPQPIAQQRSMQRLHPAAPQPRPWQRSGGPRRPQPMPSAVHGVPIEVRKRLGGGWIVRAQSSVAEEACLRVRT